MPDKHQRAVNAALDANERVGRLFDRIGHADAPRGDIYAAYRNARQALDVNNLPRAQAALRLLRQSVASISGAALSRGIDLGAAEAERQLLIYEETPPSGDPLVESRDDLILAIMAVLDSQLQAINALLVTEADNGSLILGDDTRVGLLSPAPISAEIARWAAYLTGKVFAARVSGAGGEAEYARQAVAAIDERTTDCCLRVNGQIAPLDGDFSLTGTPRFADHIHAPPFHWYCRTATALIRTDSIDDALTQSMREAARAELAARRDGSRKEIHPAHARSGR